MALFGKSDPETADVQGRPLRCQVCSSCGYIHWFFPQG